MSVKRLVPLNTVSLSADPSPAVAGDIYYNTTIDEPRIYNGTTWQKLIVNDTPQTLFNKTISTSNASLIPLTVKAAATTAGAASLTEWQYPDGFVAAAAKIINGLIFFEFTGAGTGTDSYSSILVGNAWLRNERRAALTRFNTTDGEFHIGANPDISSIAITQNQVGVFGNSTSLTTFTVKGAASQTADLQQWQNSTGTVLAKIYSNGAADFVGGGVAITGGSSLLVANNIYSVFGKLVAGNYTSTLGGQIEAYITSATNKGIVVQAAASQTANLQEWQNSSGSILASVNAYGSASFGGNNALGSSLGVGVGGSPTQKGITIKGTASQTANLQEWQNSSGSVLSWVTSNGSIIVDPSVNNSSFQVAASGGQIGDYQIIKFSQVGTDKVNLLGTIVSGGDAAFEIRQLIGSTTTTFKISETSLIGIGRGNTTPTAQLDVRPHSASVIGQVIRAAASQTADLQQWQNSSGTVLASIGSGGFALFGANAQINGDLRVGSNNLARLTVINDSTAKIGQVIRAAASQTADLQQWQDSLGTVLSRIDASGNITAPSFNLSDSKYLLRKTIKKVLSPATTPTANDYYDLFQFDLQSTSLQGTYYMQISVSGPGFGQNLTYTLPVSYVMDWITTGGYLSSNPFNGGAWVNLTPITFSPRHLMPADYINLQAKVVNNSLYLRIRVNTTFSTTPTFYFYAQQSEEFANASITEYSTVGTDSETFSTFPNFLSSNAGTTQFANPVTIVSNSTANIPLTVKAKSSQTANLQEWQHGSGTVLASVSSTGQLTSIVANNTTTGGGQIYLNGATGNRIDFNVNGAAAPSFTTRSTGTKLVLWPNVGASTVDYAIGIEGSHMWYSVDIASSTQGFKWYAATTNVMTLRGNGTLSLNSTSSTLGSGSTTHQLGVVSGAASTVGTVIRAAVSQTADLQQWQDSAGNVIVRIGSSGNLVSTAGANIFTGDTRFGTNSYFDAETSLSPRVATEKGLVIRGVASQTASLQEWQNSAGTVLSKINSSGNLTINGIFFGLGGAATNSSNISIGNDSGTGTSLTSTSERNTFIGDFSGSSAGGVSSNTLIGYASGRYNYGSGNTMLGANTGYTVVGGGGSYNTYIGFGSGYSGEGSYNVMLGYQAGQNTPGSNKLVISNSNTATPLIQGDFSDKTLTINGNQTIISQTTSSVGLIVKAAASQSANLQEWQNSSGTVMVKIAADGSTVWYNPSNGSTIASISIYGEYFSQGNIYVRSAENYGASLNVKTPTTGYIGQVIRGISGQTANLQEWQNSSGTVLAKINASGNFETNTIINTTLSTQSINSGSLSFAGISYNGISNPTGITSLPTLVIKGIASQTADLQQWHNSAGTVLTAINGDGNMIIGRANALGSASLTIQSNTPLSLYSPDNTTALYNRILFLRGNSSGNLLSITSKGDTAQGVSALVITNGTFSTEITGFGYNGNVYTNIQSASTVGLTIKAASSQTANLQEWQDSSGNVKSKIDNTGSLKVGGGAWSVIDSTYGQVSIRQDGSLLGSLTVGTGHPDVIGLAVKGAASQSANLQEWQNSSGTVLAKVDKNGNIFAPSLQSNTSSTISVNTASTVDTVALSSFTSMEYTLSIKQGSKIRSSKVLVHTDGTSVDLTEYGIMEMGGGITGILVTASVSSTNAILQVTITDAATTNATVKLIKTML